MFAISSHVLSALCALTLFANPIFPMTASADFPRPWTTVASAGTVDEADVGKVLFTNDYVTLAPGSQLFPPPPLYVPVPPLLPILPPVSTTKAVLRYNVTAVDGLFASGNGYGLYVRYLDNGPAARVIVRLKEVNFATGVINTRLTFDSDKFAALPGFQTQHEVACDAGWVFNFEENAYFIEAELSRTNANGVPSLAIVKLDRHVC